MYKISNYNWAIPYNSKLIYFNSISKKSFILNCSEHDKMKKQFEDLITFDLEYPSVFRQFKEWGFIIDEGLNELNCIKFDYMNEVLNNRNYTLSILSEEHIDDQFSSTISNHLKDMCEREKILSLYVEFIINTNCKSTHIDAIDSIIVSAKELCKDYSIELKTKVIIDDTTLSQEVVDLMIKHQFANISFNILLHKYKKLNVDFQDNITTILKSIKKCNIVLCVTYNDQCTLELFDSFLSKIDKKERKHITVTISYYSSSQDKLTVERRILDKKVDEFKFKRNTVEDNGLTFLRAFQNTITTSLKVRLWSNSYELDDCGELQSDGTIIWNRFKRNSLLGRFWFDNNMCTKCKCLPILFGACSRAVKYNGNNIELSCVLTDKSINAESIVVQLHEAQK